MLVATTSELEKFIEDVKEKGNQQFRGVQLFGVQQRTLKTFRDSQSVYTETICKSVQGHFDDLGKNCFKTVCLLT